MIITQIILILLDVNDNMLEFPSLFVRFSREKMKKTHRVWRFTMQISFWDFFSGSIFGENCCSFVSVRVATSDPVVSDLSGVGKGIGVTSKPGQRLQQADHFRPLEQIIWE